MTQAKRDQNRVPTLIGVSTADLETPTRIAVNAATGAVVIDPTNLDSRYLRRDIATDQELTADSLVISPTTNSTNTLQVLQADDTIVFNVDTTNARVGIGTVSPQELLHVGTGTNASDISATDLLVTRAGPSNLSVRDSTNGVETFLFASSVGGVMGTVTNDPLNIKTNNASAIFIDASQNVGIGETNPLARLHVNGTTDIIQTIIQAHSTQIANILEIQDSSNNVLSGVDERGILFSDGDSVDTNVFIGKDAGRVASTVGANIAIGDSAGSSLTDGSNNTMIGNLAGRDLTGGNRNIFIGPEAGKIATTGSSQIFIGSKSGSAVTTGTGNVFVGGGDKTTEGVGNLCIGPGAGQENLVGGANVYIGSEAGEDRTGSNNIAIGKRATELKTSGNFDVAIGNFALQAVGASGGGNVAIGYQAGLLHTTGGKNIFLGHQAASKQTTLSNLLIIDNQTRADVATELTNSILYGVMAAAPANQTLRINANLGVNVTPTANMDGIALEGGLLTLKETTEPTADDSYGKIWTESNNELFYQSGDGATHLLHGDAFSNMWFHGLNRDVVEITTANLFTLINSFDVVGEEDDLTNVVANTTNNDMTIGTNAAGKYSLTFHASITSSSAASEMIVAMGITLATPLNITGATNTTPIVITSNGHGLEKGDMVTIDGCTGNDAADGDWFVSVAGTDMFTIVTLAGANSVGNGVYNSGSGDVDIKYPGNLLIHRKVSLNDLVGGGANADMNLNASDKIKMYGVNIGATRDLEIAIINYEIFRIGD